MDPTLATTEPAPLPVIEPARPTGFRRTVLTAGMAAALLIACGVAAVSAASPDPSAATTPSGTTESSDDGTMSASGSTSATGTRGDCPHHESDDGTTASPTPTSTS